MPSIFVAHEGLPDLSLRPIPSDLYWKGKIRGIYKYKGNDWVVVAWFYTENHLREVGAKFVLLRLSICLNSLTKPFSLNELRLGQAELVFSNHEDVVSASCIEGEPASICCQGREAQAKKKKKIIAK